MGSASGSGSTRVLIACESCTGMYSLPTFSVGEFRKTCHPQNVEVHEIREMSFQEYRTCENLES
jgi:hypothetical protein